MLLLALCACSDFDTERTFAALATPVSKGEVKNLTGGKVSCLHCPIYFALDTAPALVDKIITEQRLHQVVDLPQEARQIEDLVQREASWWQPADPKASDKVYWVRYKARQAGLESAFRLLVVKSHRAFFITSGHFTAEYDEEGAMPDPAKAAPDGRSVANVESHASRSGRHLAAPQVRSARC